MTSAAAKHNSAGKLLVACVVGAMIGATPLFGVHVFICLVAAKIFRLNAIVVFGASNISIPPLAPFLAAACIEVGTRVLYGRGVAVDVRQLHTSPWKLAGDVFAAWFVGAPIVGGLIGLALGLVLYGVVRLKATS